MGESSTPRRPTHDTNTSRRQVNTHTHTHQQHQQQQHFIKAKQIQTHYEDYWIDCIYFDASSCCYGFNSFCKVHCISRTSILLHPTLQSVSRASKVYRKRSSAGYTLPFLSVLLRLQFVATPTMQNVRHASSV